MTKCTGVPLLSLGHDGEITLWGVAFVNPKGRTLARSSYPTPDLRSGLPRTGFRGNWSPTLSPDMPLPGKAAVAADVLCRQSLGPNLSFMKRCRVDCRAA